MSIQRFRITWDGMTYKVSEPGIESCEVVLARVYDALQKRVARLEREFLNKDQIIASLTATAQLATVTAARDAALADHLGDANNKVCTWTETKDGQYETACGMMYEFFDGGPSDNHLQYCGYCGKRLEEKRWSEPKEATCQK